MANQVSVNSILSFVTFSKKGAEILAAGNKRLEQLNTKLKQREERINKLRGEFEITDSDLVELMRKAMNDHEHLGTYSIRSPASNVKFPMGGAVRVRSGAGVDVLPQEYQKVVPAGVIQNILTEQSAMESEKDQIERLELILRNIDPESAHKVALFDLEYLGF